jgi:hypothetical protein
MRRAALIGLLLAAACADPGADPRTYDNSDLELAPSYAAKETCSCVFVMGMSDDYCLAWTKASPAVAVVSIDRDARRVDASALLLWSAGAHYDSDLYGCIEE